MTTQARAEPIELGPVDYLVVEFPGSRLTGEGLPLLVDLVSRGIIRVLDLVFVRKRDDGSVLALDVGQLEREGNPGLGVFAGATSGLLRQDDLDEVGKALEDGSSAAVLVYENLWAAPLASALARGGARLVAGGRITVPALLAALDEAESAAVGAGTREG